jgi:hypothetical protein
LQQVLIYECFKVHITFIKWESSFLCKKWEFLCKWWEVKSEFKQIALKSNVSCECLVIEVFIFGNFIVKKNTVSILKMLCENQNQWFSQNKKRKEKENCPTLVSSTFGRSLPHVWKVLYT